jgi:hypothetical protein
LHGSAGTHRPAATALQTVMTLFLGSDADARIPMLEASGAISAVLGAFLVLYPHARIRTLVLQVLLYAVVTGGALVVGAALGCFRTPPTRLTAGMLAFAAGALIVAVAFELFEPAYREARLARASGALLVGAAMFIAVDLLLRRYASAGAAGLALVAAATLDGVRRASPSVSGSPRAVRTRSSPRLLPRSCRRRSPAPPACTRTESPPSAFSPCGC